MKYLFIALYISMVIYALGGRHTLRKISYFIRQKKKKYLPKLKEFYCLIFGHKFTYYKKDERCCDRCGEEEFLHEVEEYNMGAVKEEDSVCNICNSSVCLSCLHIKANDKHSYNKWF